MTNWRTLVSNSDTLSVADLRGGTVTAKIESVKGGEFEGESKTDHVALISFVGKEKKLAANVINCTLMEAMWGEEVEAWVGHMLSIGPDKVEVAGSFYGQPCIRVKGSPELERPLTVSIALKAQGGRKRKPFDKHLVPTPRGESANVAPAAMVAPGSDDFDGLFPVDERGRE
jgi:hypothetical protein